MKKIRLKTTTQKPGREEISNVNVTIKTSFLELLSRVVYLV